MSRLFFIYKKNSQDPTEKALKRWLPRFVNNFKEFSFFERERFLNKNLIFSTRLEKAVEKFKPTHIFCWVLYLNPIEIEWLKKKGIKIVLSTNGFSSLHTGLFSDQKLYFECLKKIDLIFVTHKPHAQILRKYGIKVQPLDFFYDPELYKPINSIFKNLFNFSDIFFVGNIADFKIKNTQSSYRKEILEALGMNFNLQVISNFRKFSSKIKVIKPTKYDSKINFYMNISRASLCLDFFPDIHHYNKIINNQIEIYEKTPTYVMRPRTFISMGSGLPVFVEKYNEISDLFQNNVDIVMWKNKEDLIQKVKFYLRNKNELLEISKKGLKNVRENHTVESRLINVILPAIFD